MNSILSRNPQTVQQSAPINNQMQMIQQFKQFKNSFKGDPKQVVINMLQRGQITNPQLQQAMQMANQLKGVLK